MAALRSLTLPLGPFFSADGKLAVGHAVACYNPGTDTLRTWYADAALTTPAPNPDRTGSDGRLAQKFLGVGPSEIRQYAPVSASSTIPNDLQDFPGTEWALVETWLEDGLVADAGSTIYTVDTVDELRALTDPAAIDGLVAVIGYSSASDEIGVRYYLRDQYSVASDDGGAVLNALAGGRWVLKTDGGEVDARVWGVMANGTDVTSNLAAAASWANANGATLYIAPGVYTVSSGSIAIANAHIADGVQIKATSGAYSVELTGHWAVDGTGALQHANSTGDVRLAFGASADVGTAYMSWNGTDGDLGYYPNQNVVHSADSTGLLTIDGPLSLASFTLAKDTNSSITGAVEIGVLHCNGYTLSATDDGTLTIGVFDRAGTDPVGLDWDAGDAPTVRVLYDFRTSDVDVNALSALDGDYKPVTLTVDADRTLTGSATWPKVTLQAAGGLLSAGDDTVTLSAQDIRGESAIFGSGWVNGTTARISVTTFASLRPSNFNGALGNAGFLSVATNHSGAVLDLEGKTANIAALGTADAPGVPLNPSIRNGAIVFTQNANVTLRFTAENVAFTLADPALTGLGLEIDGPAAVAFRNCSFDGSGTLFTATADGVVTLELDGCAVYTKFHVDPSGANKTIAVVNDCAFLTGKSVWFGHGDVYVYDNEFSGVVDFVGAPGYIEFCRNRLAAGASPLQARLISTTNVTTMAYAYRVLIADNEPAAHNASDLTSPYWPQTRGWFEEGNAVVNTWGGYVHPCFYALPASPGVSFRADGAFVATSSVGAVRTDTSPADEGGPYIYPESSGSGTVSVRIIFDVSR